MNFLAPSRELWNNSLMLFQKDDFFKLIGGDKELFRSLLELYSEDWPEVVAKIEEGIENNNAESVEHYGHRIKGNLRNFYANELSEIAMTIEESGRQGQVQELGSEVDKLKSGLKSLEEELSQYYKSL